MPIEEHNLIEMKEVAPNIFVCLYQGLMFELRLLDAGGSAVDLQKEGFVLHNLTHNQPNSPYRSGKAVYFALLKTEWYSLRLKGREVWSYGVAPDMGLGLSPAVEAKRKRDFDAILAFLQAHSQELGYHHSLDPAAIQPQNIAMLDGDMGIPWDPELFHFVPDPS